MRIWQQPEWKEAGWGGGGDFKDGKERVLDNIGKKEWDGEGNTVAKKGKWVKGNMRKIKKTGR